MNIYMAEDIRLSLTLYARSIGVEIESMKYNNPSKTLTLYFTTPPTPSQRQQLLDAVPVLTNQEVFKDVDKYDTMLMNTTPAQVEQYVDNNVTDLASAKLFLKRLGKAVLFLYHKTQESN